MSNTKLRVASGDTLTRSSDFKRKRRTRSKNILDIPVEILSKNLFIHLKDVDTFNLGIALAGKMRQITETHLINSKHQADETSVKFMKISKQSCQSQELPKVEVLMVFNQAIESEDAEYVFKYSLENFPFHLDQASTSSFVDMMCNKPLVKNENDIYEYVKTEDKWNLIVSGFESVSHDKSKQMQLNRNHSEVCFTSDNTFISFGGNLMSYVEWIHLASGGLDYQSDKASIVQDRHYKKLSQTCSPLSGVRYHTITRIRQNSVMIIGGELILRSKNGKLKSSPTSMVSLISEYDWILMPPMKNERSHHVSFQMNRSIYVVGGKDAKNKLLASCERFNGINWIPSQYSLPYPICMASVFVSKDETFAVLIGGRRYRWHGFIGHSIMHKYDNTYQHNDKIIIFTEKNGWKVIRTVSSAHFTASSGQNLVE